MPEYWVVRDRSHDYGVDFEVEVFTPSGDATGLIFLAQLKATDASVRADRLRILRQQLDYLDTLDLPVAIFRYASQDDVWWWSWLFDPNISHATGGGETAVTVRFPPHHAWVSDAPAVIETTLRVKRALRLAGPRDKVALVCAEDVPPRRRFEIDAAIGEIVEATESLTQRRDAASFIIEVAASDESLRVTLDRLASVVFPISGTDRLTANVLYAIIAMMRGLKLHTQAEHTARTALSLNATITVRSLAAQAVAALSMDPVAAAELGILNNLHRDQDLAWVMTYHQLVSAPVPAGLRRAGVELFAEAALSEARSNGDQCQQGILRYNMANACLAAGRPREALSHLNAARRLRPAYMVAGHFLIDIGRSLYDAQRYRLAAVFYRAAADLVPDKGVRHYLADALMFSGLVKEAEALYRELEADIDNERLSEFALKAALCAALAADAGAPIVPARPGAALAWFANGSESKLMDPAALSRVLHEFDAFDPVANFNLGVANGRAGQHEDAISHFLACAFRRSSDIEAWANAVITAVHLESAIMAAAVLDCALRMGGFAVRQAVRKEILAQATSEAQIEAWEEMMGFALDGISQTPKGVLFRMLPADDGGRLFQFRLE
jgi:tetratricopeptide (TPR) repeat protein